MKNSIIVQCIESIVVSKAIHRVKLQLPGFVSVVYIVPAESDVAQCKSGHTYLLTLSEDTTEDPVTQADCPQTKRTGERT